MRGTSLSNYPAATVMVNSDGVPPPGIPRRGRTPRRLRPTAPRRHRHQSAADVTGTPDFGRRLAQLQGIEILGPVGVAARTAATVADALRIFENFLSAYSPVISLRATIDSDPDRTFIEYLMNDRSRPLHPGGLTNCRSG